MRRAGVNKIGLRLPPLEKVSLPSGQFAKPEAKLGGTYNFAGKFNIDDMYFYFSWKILEKNELVILDKQCQSALLQNYLIIILTSYYVFCKIKTGFAIIILILNCNNS